VRFSSHSVYFLLVLFHCKFVFWHNKRLIGALAGLLAHSFIGCVHNQKSNRSRFVRRDRSSLMKKNAFVRFITVIISHNTSVPMNWPFGIGLCHNSWPWLTKILPGRRIFLSRLRPDLDLIVNADRFAQIDRIDGIFDYERNHSFVHLSRFFWLLNHLQNTEKFTTFAS